jgi:uncharacterized protein
MYNGADQSWRDLPRFMDLDVAAAALDDIAEYANEIGLRSVALIFHGGEPTLYPISQFQKLLELIRERIDGRGIESRLSIQTNLTVPRPGTRSLLLKEGVAFGVSVDLSKESHDRYRVDLKGRGTFDRVSEELDKLQAVTSGEEPRGALLVIDPTVSPVDAFEFIESLGVGFVDLRLPDETWETADEASLSDRFRMWLLDFFDLYTRLDRHFTVRWFQTAMKLAAGGSWGSDMLGLRSAGTVILDTDGSFDLHDVLRMASEEANDTRIHAGERGISSIEALAGMQLMMDKEAHLAEECVGCPVVKMCGGGHVAHRYSSERGLANRSVYCRVLKPFYHAVALSVGAID